MRLDETDIKLLNLVQEDGKRPVKELSSELNLTIGPVHERLKKLERSGLINKYVALLDIQKLDFNLIMYCSVTVEKHTAENLSNFEMSVREMDEVLECYMVAGTYDFIMKIIVKDMDAYQVFLTEKLSRLGKIASMNSHSVMKCVKYTTAVKVG